MTLQAQKQPKKAAHLKQPEGGGFRGQDSQNSWL